MTLRLRYILAIVPLFTGLGIANALVRYFLEKYEVMWSLDEQAKGAALTIATFAGQAAPAAETPPEELRASCAQFARRMGGLTAAWFVESAGTWRASTLIETPGLRLPAAPDEAVLAALRRRGTAPEGAAEGQPPPAANPGAVARLLERPVAESPHDEALGYAGVFAADNRLRGIVGVSMPETLFRARRQVWIREGLVLVALVGLLGWGIAESLTQLARGEIKRLQVAGDALSRGNYPLEWTPGRIRELNDLGGTLQTMASLLRDHLHRTRRRLLLVDPFPREHELALAWHDACDDTPDLATPNGRVLLRRIGDRHSDDFFGRRETPGHWVVAAGRLEPAPGATIERILRSTTARDYFLGVAARAGVDAESLAGPFLFPFRQLDVLLVPKDGRPVTGWSLVAGAATAPGPQPLPGPRGVAGTLPLEARQLAADFVRHFPPSELPLHVDELGGLLAGRGDGILLVYAFDDHSPPAS